MSAVDQIERLCEVLHDAYEQAAAGAGWETNPASRRPWADVPDENKQATRAAVVALLQHLDAMDRLSPFWHVWHHALAVLVPVPPGHLGDCVWCPGDFESEHDADCPYAKALALLEGVDERVGAP